MTVERSPGAPPVIPDATVALVRMMAEAHWSYEEISRALDIDPRHVSRIARGLARKRVAR